MSSVKGVFLHTVQAGWTATVASLDQYVYQCVLAYVAQGSVLGGGKKRICSDVRSGKTAVTKRNRHVNEVIKKKAVSVCPRRGCWCLVEWEERVDDRELVAV